MRQKIKLMPGQTVWSKRSRGIAEIATFIGMVPSGQRKDCKIYIVLWHETGNIQRVEYIYDSRGDALHERWPITRDEIVDVNVDPDKITSPETGEPVKVEPIPPVKPQRNKAESVPAFTTTDGKIFTDEGEADQHQVYLDFKQWKNALRDEMIEDPALKKLLDPKHINLDRSDHLFKFLRRYRREMNGFMRRIKPLPEPDDAGTV